MNAYFSGLESGSESPFEAPPTLGKNDKLDEIVSMLEGTTTVQSGTGNQSLHDTANVYRLVRAFYSHGHLLADVDPLQLEKHYADNASLREKFRFPGEKMKNYLNYKTYGFTEADLDRTFYIDLPNQGAIMSKKKDWKLRELITVLENAYCKKIGVEFMHMSDRDAQKWIREKFEGL